MKFMSESGCRKFGLSLAMEISAFSTRNHSSYRRFGNLTTGGTEAETMHITWAQPLLEKRILHPFGPRKQVV